MKQIKTLLLAAVCFLGAASFANAQDKIAHINTQELISAMPKMITAQKQLEQIQKTYQAEMKSLMDAYQSKLKQYQAEVETVTQAANEARQKEVASMEQNIREYEQNAQRDLQKKQVDLQKPLFEEARTAIQKVARAKGIKYVLDATNGQGLILADGTDLMADVKKELGF
jgi:outer membrane protein